MSEEKDAFLEWCSLREIKTHGVELRKAEEGAGNGVFSLRSVRMNEVLLSLPVTELIIAGRVADMKLYSELLHRTKFRPTPFEMLVIFFYHEQEESSDFGPYLRMLPHSFDTPVAKGIVISEADLPGISRPFWQQQREELHSITSRLSAVLPYPLDTARLIWAWHIVNTRCIYVENKSHEKIDQRNGDTIAVIPLVDMLNHSPQAQCHAELDKVNGRYILRAEKGIPEGHELYVCYGPHDNARLWLEYGFRLPSHLNPFTRVNISTEVFMSLAGKCGIEVTEKRREILLNAAIACTLYATDEGPGWGLGANLRILTMPHSQLSDWQSIIYSEKNGNEEEECAEREENEEKTRSILIQLVLLLSSKKEKVSQDAKWIWEEQIQLVNSVLSSLADNQPFMK